MAIESGDPATGELPRVSSDDTGGPPRPRRFRPVRFTLKLLAFVTIVSLIYHVWVGMRDIWMDYIKPVSVRLTLDIATIAWLVGCAGWAIQVLWRL